MRAVLTAFANSPDRGRGLARDFRIRWALEELGQACDVRLVGLSDLKTPAHRTLHPFGQIPTWEEEGLVLFESGAIVLHLAERHPGLLPRDTACRARAMAWVFAAIDTVEPPIWDWDLARMLESDEPWHAQRQPVLEARIRQRLGQLAIWLGENKWLEGSFTLGDLMMVTVLRRLHGSKLLNEQSSLADYVARGEARPAFRRAITAQKADFDASSAATTVKGQAE
jgi:glutathione S-transferase